MFMSHSRADIPVVDINPSVFSVVVPCLSFGENQLSLTRDPLTSRLYFQSSTSNGL